MKRVLLGISGGVDSAVSALLLKQQGYEVIAVFMDNWDRLTNNDLLDSINSECSSLEDFNDAKKVCKILDIKLYKVNYQKEYWKYVFLPFIKSIKNNITPNPDIWCNNYIKFNIFKDELLSKYNAEYYATGHYARLITKNNIHHLEIPFDTHKDQTYFLSRLKQSHLEKVIFPLENLSKEMVREIARKNKLPISNKKDSVGICFIGKRTFNTFLQNYIPKSVGDFIDWNTNKKVGEHIGTAFYSVGQRKGLHIATDEKPYFVYKKDIDKNIVYLIKGLNNPLRFANIITLKDVVFLQTNYKDIKEKKYLFRIRHGQIPVEGKLINKNNMWKVVLDKDHKDITPGQTCVFYDNNELIGSGYII